MKIKSAIIQYLTELDSWIYGGQIERRIGDVTEHKASNVGRILREMASKGILDVQRVQINGAGPRVTQYRIASDYNKLQTEQQSLNNPKQKQLFDTSRTY